MRKIMLNIWYNVTSLISSRHVQQYSIRLADGIIQSVTDGVLTWYRFQVEHLVYAFALEDEVGGSEAFGIRQNEHAIAMLYGLASCIQKIVVIVITFTSCTIDAYLVFHRRERGMIGEGFRVWLKPSLWRKVGWLEDCWWRKMGLWGYPPTNCVSNAY